MDATKLDTITKDLTKDFPRSPREKLGDYVIAGRTLDKCRAVLLGKEGEYKFNCPLDREFFDFSKINANQFKECVASGATDHEVAAWIHEHATDRPRVEIVKWNNRLRGMRISELPDDAQEFLEDYIENYIPKGRQFYSWFDVYDLEEQRL
ncbi:DUF5069 domain-containing protein [Candidatus Nitronereus thalassa]|uniref:DUF5069 domain-containing protein n=1 Tax=Candidatus Nitronereus thalassa TaxID=3020898 RepID=A0ABU3KB59_9BACT|nr:DUF5069 domain-containing protein [Candidatus Nitronereus thalassa]MDT7043724.1 DUF5069 domain-containing protein [Candidatus Nitronereus thalassa]